MVHSREIVWRGVDFLPSSIKILGVIVGRAPEGGRTLSKEDVTALFTRLLELKEERLPKFRKVWVESNIIMEEMRELRNEITKGCEATGLSLELRRPNSVHKFDYLE